MDINFNSARPVYDITRASLVLRRISTPRNVLSVLMHCFAIACLASVAWLVVVYSLAFSDGGGLNSYIGGLSKAF